MFSGLLSTQGFQAILKSHQHGAARIALINENLANANTPDYKPKDLVPLDQSSKSSFQSTVMSTTAVGHIKGHAKPEGSYKVVEVKRKDLQAAGGPVDLNEQLGALQETYTKNVMLVQAFQRVARLYSTVLNRR